MHRNLFPVLATAAAIALILSPLIPAAEPWAMTRRGVEIVLEYWMTVGAYVVLLAAIGGWIGGGFGLANLFHEDSAMRALHRSLPWWLNSPTLFGAMSASTMSVYVVGVIVVMEEGPRRAVAQAWMDAAPVFLGAALFALATYLAPPPPPRRRPTATENLRAVLGWLIGLGIGAVALWLSVQIVDLGFVFSLAEIPGLRPDFVALGLAMLLVSAPALLLVLLPALAFTMLMLWISLLTTTLAEISAIGRLFAVGGLFLWVIVAAKPAARLWGHAPHLKFHFPGIDAPNGQSHYAPGNALPLKSVLPDAFFFDPQEGPVASTARLYRQKAAVQPQRASDALDPVAVLEAWAARQRARHGPEHKPRMMMVATSGGAYRAGFWTAMVLDAAMRDPKMPDLAGNTRLITGASGGMVGAAYFAALLDVDKTGRVILPEAPILNRIEADILASQTEGTGALPRHETRFPVPRDSLSPVIRQLMGGDILSLFSTRARSVDRGTVLEDQWL
ncbi:MAG: hypothetical protein AAF281_11400, partial [Pseudomonadota bacterium]